VQSDSETRRLPARAGSRTAVPERRRRAGRCRCAAAPAGAA